MTANEYWNQYLSKTGQNAEDTVFSGELCFENAGLVGETQLALVLSGKKTAVFTPFEAFAINREPLPVVGEVYIAEDADGNPHGIVEITGVQVLEFCEITWEMAMREGEDASFDDWKEKQREYMQEEADLCGFDFNDGSRVVFETFRLIYK